MGARHHVAPRALRHSGPRLPRERLPAARAAPPQAAGPRAQRRAAHAPHLRAGRRRPGRLRLERPHSQACRGAASHLALGPVGRGRVLPVSYSCVLRPRPYRRLMTAIDYFRAPVDPFQLQKDLGLTSAVESISMLAVRVNDVLAASPPQLSDPEHLSHFQSFVLTSLWGNRMDLSLWPVGGADQATVNATGGQTHTTQSFSSVLEAGQKMILSNHITQLVDYVSRLAPTRFDIIVDNAGFELFCDLCLADFLVHTGMATVVHIQLKAHPTFVSDAMAKDVRATVSFLQEMCTEQGAPTPSTILGDRWATHLSSGRWLLTEQFFWVQPQPMWEMPPQVRDDLSHSALTFVKGDANYRRLLGDRDWPYDTPFDDILCYFPSPVCALRTLKAELGCGMSHQQTARAAREDEKWLVAGKYAVVQFCNTRLV
ncbi:Protein-glutamate O-methyltransferase [Gracilaria domingensis]|nr:Protein-glutamate O-methyltransferase [Gracilaria domingensis]